MKGDASVAWAVAADTGFFGLNATVPPDVTASVVLPCAGGDVAHEVGGGSWAWVC